MSQLKKYINLFLFISAYTPLFIILSIYLLEEYFVLSLILIIITVIADLIFYLLIKGSKNFTETVYTVKNSENRTANSLNYVVAYVVAFLGISFSKWQDFVTLIIIMATIYVVFINSNLIFVNPLLNVFNYRIFSIEVEEGGKIILITKTKKLEKNDKINIRNIADDIYIEV